MYWTSALESEHPALDSTCPLTVFMLPVKVMNSVAMLQRRLCDAVQN